MLTILQGDALTRLRELPDESVHCCVTSPPYWGLRDYRTAEWEGGEGDCDHIQGRPGAGRADGIVDERMQRNRDGAGAMGGDCGKCGAKRIDSQLGLEKTPEEYVAKMVEIFREVRRVLRKDGTLWLNLGDSYAGGGNGAANYPGDYPKQNSNAGTLTLKGRSGVVPHGLKPKDLCGIPWRVAFALQSDGWYLRQDIIWAKPNPMPESVTDRCTKAHEYLFLLTKSARYFYDAEAIKERLAESTIEWGNGKDGWGASNPNHAIPQGTHGPSIRGQGRCGESGNSRNKRSVWTVATAPYPEAHFATYPPDLIKPCIMAGTSAKGCCAKCGAPWERIVERKPMVIDRSDRTHELGRTRSSGTMLEPNEAQTLGWQPTCECESEIQPCTVLDMFAGSGTTGAVALELGREAILIELNPKYVELIEQRCNVTMGLALA